MKSIDSFIDEEIKLCEKFIRDFDKQRKEEFPEMMKRPWFAFANISWNFTDYLNGSISALYRLKNKLNKP